MKYREINGDLIKLALSGEFDVIAHGVNCFCKQKSGLAPQMVKTFSTNLYFKEQVGAGDISKLGSIEFQVFMIHENETRGFSLFFNGWSKNKHIKDLVVVNAYTQYKYGKNHEDGVDIPLDYEALTLCMRKINHTFKGKHIGLPQIGCGLAGGNWSMVKSIIQKELKDCDVTVVIYKK